MPFSGRVGDVWMESFGVPSRLRRVVHWRGITAFTVRRSFECNTQPMGLRPGCLHNPLWVRPAGSGTISEPTAPCQFCCCPLTEKPRSPLSCRFSFVPWANGQRRPIRHNNRANPSLVDALRQLPYRRSLTLHTLNVGKTPRHDHGSPAQRIHTDLLRSYARGDPAGRQRPHPSRRVRTSRPALAPR